VYEPVIVWIDFKVFLLPHVFTKNRGRLEYFLAVQATESILPNNKKSNTKINKNG
jgi:hypothetical protein